MARSAHAKAGGRRGALRLAPIAAAGRLAIGALLFGVTTCGSLKAGNSVPGATGTRGAVATGSADVGPLRISGAYIPQQTSQDEAAAYFAVTNTGDAADTLIEAQTTGAAQAMLHDTVEDGGVGTMTAMSDLTIPAQLTVPCTPGHEHLMIMNPVRRLTQGQTLVLTLTFTHAVSSPWSCRSSASPDPSRSASLKPLPPGRGPVDLPLTCGRSVWSGRCRRG